MSLAGRVAIITGASSGIGAATARAFAAEGISVVLAARRRDRLDALSAEIGHHGGTALPVTCDVTSDDDVAALMTATLDRFQHVDIVVCNAGAGYFGRVEETPPEAMARLMDLNFMGSFLVAHAAIPHLRRQARANLLFVSSIAGQRGIPFSGAYSATKFAQVGLAEALRAELIDTSVRVSVVLPVSTETELRAVMAREQGFAITGHGPRQSPDVVAQAMVRCLKRPRAEVHPHIGSRALALLSALAPGFSDRIVRRYGRKPIETT